MAINWEILRTRYLGAGTKAQIESLILNLFRLQVLANSGAEESAAQHLVRESQLFIEWTVPCLNLETDINFATDLVSLQRLLSEWKANWPELWHSPEERKRMADGAKRWCDQLQSNMAAIAS